jgi:hypothetical protein
MGSVVTGKNATPLVGWHPSAGLVAWLDAEVERRGGGRGVRSGILEEALARLKEAAEAPRRDGAGARPA